MTTTYTHTNGNTYNVLINNDVVYLTSDLNHVCPLQITLENFSKLVNIEEYTEKLNVVEFEFEGVSYKCFQDSIFLTCVNTGKKIEGLYRRGTKWTGQLVESYLRIRNGKLDIMPRYEGGSKGYMHLVGILTK